jgi:uncharacterized protein YbaP (TraB family)
MANAGWRAGTAGGIALAWLAAASAAAAPVVWTVDGGDNEVYLFGSVHLLPEGDFAVDGALEDALARADRVCLEIDPSAQNEAETLSLTLARAVDPEGRSLFDLLGPDADRIRARAEDAGVDIAQFGAFEPWFAGMTVSLLALQQHGYDGEHGVERVIQAAAEAEGTPLCGLETLDEQLALLDAMPADSQRELLLQSIDEADEVDELIRPMVSAWRDGDLDYLERRLAEDVGDYPDLAEPLIFDRNARWSDDIARMLRGTDDVLVVVGAMHLVGERGVPALLEKRGFTVEAR